jgi:hypothetical protein
VRAGHLSLHELAGGPDHLCDMLFADNVQSGPARRERIRAARGFNENHEAGFVVREANTGRGPIDEVASGASTDGADKTGCAGDKYRPVVRASRILSALMGRFPAFCIAGGIAAPINRTSERSKADCLSLRTLSRCCNRRTSWSKSEAIGAVAPQGIARSATIVLLCMCMANSSQCSVRDRSVQLRAFVVLDNAP